MDAMVLSNLGDEIVTIFVHILTLEVTMLVHNNGYDVVLHALLREMMW
jgi:hypothetical protein